MGELNDYFLNAHLDFFPGSDVMFHKVKGLKPVKLKKRVNLITVVPDKEH